MPLRRHTGRDGGLGAARSGAAAGYYPPVLRGRRVLSDYIPPAIELRLRRATTRGPGAFTRGGAVIRASGCGEWRARYATRAPVDGHAVRWYAGPAGAARQCAVRNPRTGAIGRTVRGSRRACGSWDRPRCSAVISGRRRRVSRTDATGRPAASRRAAAGRTLTRRGPQGTSAVGSHSRRWTPSTPVATATYTQSGGSWQKYGDGGWMPDAQRAVGTSSVASSAHTGCSTNPRHDQSTQHLIRSARIDGAQRTRDSIARGQRRFGKPTARAAVEASRGGGGSFRAWRRRVQGAVATLEHGGA